MNRYELINPSDPIVFDAPSDELAALVALYVGEGAYPVRADEVEGREVIGLAVFGGDGGFEKKYGKSLAVAFETMDSQAFVAACQSFRIRDGRKSTSLNDICGYAHSIKLKEPAQWSVGRPAPLDSPVGASTGGSRASTGGHCAAM